MVEFLLRLHGSVQPALYQSAGLQQPHELCSSDLWLTMWKACG